MHWVSCNVTLYIPVLGQQSMQHRQQLWRPGHCVSSKLHVHSHVTGCHTRYSLISYPLLSPSIAALFEGG